MLEFIIVVIIIIIIIIIIKNVQFRPAMVHQNSITNQLVHLDQVFVGQLRKLLYRSVRQHHVSFVPEQASAFRRHASQGASLVAQVCCGGKSAFPRVQTSKDTCVGVKSYALDAR